MEREAMSEQTLARRMEIITPAAEFITPAVETALEALKSSGCAIDVHTSNDLAEDAANIARDKPDVLVAVGGDGTLHQVVNGVMQSGCSDAVAVGVLPSGTGNDFAGQFSIPVENPDAALSLAARGDPTLLDLGRVNGKYFINIASAGHAAQVTTETPEQLKHFLGKMAYVLTGIASLSSLEPYTVRVQSDAVDWEGEAYLLAVGNGAQTGGGFAICAQASLTDGFLDLAVVPALPFEGLVDIADAIMLQQRPQEHPDVIYAQSVEFRIAADKELQINLDGEPEKGREFKFEAVPQALRFMLPAPPV
jgi:lipid kinase YegS